MAYKEKKTFFGYGSTTPNSGKVFAPKLIRVLDATEDDIETEAKALDRLCGGVHDNIIQVLKHRWLKTDGSIYFIDMEFADISLSDYLKYVYQTQPLPSHPRFRPRFNSVFSQREISKLQRLHTAWAIGSQVTNGLDFMHGKDLVHRDLKPENSAAIFEGSLTLLLLYCSQRNQWMRTDFGFTSEAMSTLKSSLYRRGTAGYRPP
jgi:serine/threonine protein kinase